MRGRAKGDRGQYHSGGSCAGAREAIGSMISGAADRGPMRMPDELRQEGIVATIGEQGLSQ